MNSYDDDNGHRTDAPRARRMTPEARRRQIIEVARTLLLEHPGEAVSTADVAKAAGVTRALVHHYFRGIDELRQAVALDVSVDGAALLGKGTETPVDERLTHNIGALLDVVEQNRHVWLAMIAAEGEHPVHTPATERIRRAILRQMLVNNGDLVDDTAWTRLCLTGYIGFADTLLRQWVLERTDRASLQRVLVATLRNLLLQVIPEGAARPTPEAAGPPHP